MQHNTLTSPFWILRSLLLEYSSRSWCDFDDRREPFDCKNVCFPWQILLFLWNSIWIISALRWTWTFVLLISQQPSPLLQRSNASCFLLLGLQRTSCPVRSRLNCLSFTLGNVSKLTFYLKWYQILIFLHLRIQLEINVLLRIDSWI